MATTWRALLTDVRGTEGNVQGEDVERIAPLRHDINAHTVKADTGSVGQTRLNRSTCDPPHVYLPVRRRTDGRDEVKIAGPRRCVTSARGWKEYG